MQEKELTIEQALEVAISFQERGDVKSAENIYVQILNADSKCADAWHLYGLLAINAGDLQKAIEFINQAILIESKSSLFHSNLGEAYSRSGDCKKAIDSLLTAIKLDGKNQNAYFNIANIYKKVGDLKSAKIHFEKSIELKKNDIDALYNLANLYYEEGDFENAIKRYEAILRLDKNNYNATINLSNALSKIYKFEKSITLLNNAIELFGSEDKELYFNRANSYKSLFEYSKAIEDYKWAIKIDENFIDAHINLSFALLASGELAQGFREYEWRLKKDSSIKLEEFDSDIEKGRLFIYHEQGFGDTIMFSILLKKLREVNKNFIFLPQKELSFVLEVEEEIENIPNKDEYDKAIPLGSLPNILGIKSKEEIPLSRSIFFEKKSNLKVGLFWRGNPKFEHAQEKMIPLERFLDILEIEDIEFYSLQKDGGKEEIESLNLSKKIVDIGSKFQNFSDTKEAIKSLDIVVSIDSAVAHLAGYMGKKTILLLHKDCDWRWGYCENSSYWYESVEIIRQERYGEWSSVNESLKMKLKDYISS